MLTIIVLIILLIVSLTMYVACFRNYLKTEKENAGLKEENRRLTLLSASLREAFIMADSTKNISAEPNIKEAVRYAMLKSHPDNGGKSEDFVKFRKLYERMK